MPDLYNELDNPPATDWNVTLGITKPDVPPPVDQYGGLRLSKWTDIPIEEAQSFLRMAEVERQRQDEARSAAIRYQGQVDFQRLIDSGVTADQAMRQAGPKMFYKHPQALAVAIPHMQKAGSLKPTMQLVGEDGGFKVYQVTDADGKPHILREVERETKVSTPTLNIQLSNVGSRIRQAEGKLAAAKSEEERSAIVSDLQMNYDERDAIINEIRAVGGNVATPPRPRFESVPQVATPPDMRSTMQKVLPNFLGGASAPQPVTNTVTRMMPGTNAPVQPVLQTPPLDTMRQQLQDTGVAPGAANMPAPEPPNYVPETPPAAVPTPDLAPRTAQSIADRRMSILTNPPPAQTAPAGVPLLNAPVQPPPAAAEPQGAASKPVRIRRKSDGKVFIYRGRAADVPKDQYEIL